jgi:CBS domain-containing protein
MAAISSPAGVTSRARMALAPLPSPVAAVLGVRRVEEVMQTALLCVHEDDTIVEAIRVMVEHRLKRLPVVDAEGVFQGMISREAVLRAGTAGSG